MRKRAKKTCPECGDEGLTWPTVIILGVLCGTGLGALYMVLAFLVRVLP